MQDNSEKRMVSGWWIVPLAIGGIVIWGKALMMIFRLIAEAESG